MNTPTTDYPPLSPYLSVRDAAQAIDFYKAAFGAVERFRLTDKKSGKVVHAELLIQGSLIMLAEENPQWGNKSPGTLGGTPVTFSLIVKNADTAFDRAVAAGATVLMPLADQFYGFRSCSVSDPFGHQWMLQHEIEKVSPEEMQKRWDAMGGECSGAADASK
jgi:PhnB protein